MQSNFAKIGKKEALYKGICIAIVKQKEQVIELDHNSNSIKLYPNQVRKVGGELSNSHIVLLNTCTRHVFKLSPYPKVVKAWTVRDL